MAHRLFPLAIALIPALAVAQISSPNWDSTDPQIRAICERVGQPRPPAADRPSTAQAKALKGCNSEKLYYGEGIKPDYARARQCAFLEAGKNDRLGFYGNVVLMQIYANGHGVRRNLDLATAYACQIDGAPMENAGRVADLQALKTEPGDFDYCDDITSGLAQGECAGRDSNQAAAVRDARINALVGKISPTARSLYAATRKTLDAFLDAHGDEVDQSGTARAAMMIEEENVVRDQFLKDLGRLTSGHWPTASAADARSADARLNASYRQALAWSAGKDNLTTIKSDDIRKAQRTWLAYRDAYARFAIVAARGISGDAILARLSRLRTAQLDKLSSD